jgi:nicotinamide phosphoribosyltransferase
VNPAKQNREIDDINFIELTDSYKVTHWKQLPPSMTRSESFFESRGGVFPEVTFYGLQYYLKRYLSGVVITPENVAEAQEDFELHFSGDTSLYNRDGWEHILANGGKLPILVRAIPEGITVPTGNAMMTVQTTDPRIPWIDGYVETLLTMLWYPCTIATQSRAMRRLIQAYLEKTGDPSLIDFKVHDFGFRGSTSVESAGIGASAHLLSFRGTDTQQGNRVARKYYNERMAGFSIPAAEHRTITAWGRDNELRAYANMLKQFPTGTVAVVSDSYNLYDACRNLWGDKLRDAVLERDGILVVRPDSGFPPDIVVAVLEMLGKAFGHSTNSKGYEVLNPKVRIIQGDGIDYAMIERILQVMDWKRWSADNVNYGSGGGLLQNVNRDTQKIAYKCDEVEIDGAAQDVMKDPITDPGKRSKAGRQALVQVDGAYATVRATEAARLGLKNELVPVLMNGDLLVDHAYSEVRERAAR